MYMGGAKIQVENIWRGKWATPTYFESWALVQNGFDWFNSFLSELIFSPSNLALIGTSQNGLKL